MSPDTHNLNADAGTARLWIVIPVALLSFFYEGILEYSLPLYFSALTETAKASGGYFPVERQIEAMDAILQREAVGT